MASLRKLGQLIGNFCFIDMLKLAQDYVYGKCNKQEVMGGAEDEVQFAAPGAEIGGAEFEGGLLQMFFGRALAQFAAPQMLRLRLASEMHFKLFQEIHRHRLNTNWTRRQLFSASPRR
jgi:hypothetical protein